MIELFIAAWCLSGLVSFVHYMITYVHKVKVIDFMVGLPFFLFFGPITLFSTRRHR